MKTLNKNIVGKRRLPENLPAQVVLENATILGFANASCIEIENGKIKSIAAHSPDNYNGVRYDLSGKTIVPGAIDLHAVFREPGNEAVETLKTGTLAAAAGGFTQVCIMPSTTPPVDTVELCKFIKNKTEEYVVGVNVIGALTKGREGKSIAPYAELAEEGAVAFSDGRSHIKSPNLMQTALTYLKMLDAPVIVKPADAELNGDGQMHEGFESMRLGFYGMPTIAEETIVSRDLHIAEYVGGKIHFTNISTKGSVELIRQAKSKGIKVTCDVAVHNLMNTDKVIESFDTNYKLDPPLRSQDHVDALINGLQDGTIDVITSAHVPHSWEEKEAEFIYAPFGAVSLETMLPLLLDKFVHTGIFTLEKLIELVSSNPAKIFDLNANELREGAQASIAILDLEKEWQIDKNRFVSKSENSPYHGTKVKGDVFGVISNNKSYWKNN